MSIIRESIQIISEPLSHIVHVNLSIAYGIVPGQMKIARVVPLFKADDPSLFTDYRPVLILPSFSKFLERIIYNRILDYLTNFHILCDNQFGFRKNHSTMLALIDLRNKISSDLGTSRQLNTLRKTTTLLSMKNMFRQKLLSSSVNYCTKRY